MNLFLTDLNLLSPDLPQSPAMAADGDASFTRLLHEQFPAAAADDSQTFDLKHFFSEVEVATEMPPKASQALPVELLAQFTGQQPGLTAAVATSPPPPVEVAMPAPFGTLPLPVESAAEGVSLPQGGNPLPDMGAVPAPGDAPVPVTAVSGQAAGGAQAAVSPAVSSLPAAAALAVAADDAPGRRAARAPALPETPLSPSPVSAAAAISSRAVPRPASAPVAGESAPMAGSGMGAGDTPAKAPLAAQAHRPLPVERQVASAAPSALPDAAASAATAARGASDIFSAQTPPAMAESRRHETAAIEIPPAPRGAVAVDNARQPDSRTPAEFVTAATRLTPEAGAAVGEAGVRGAEMPMPANGVQAQSNAAAQLPLSQPVMTPVQTTASAPLTVPLEIPGLARGADTADWGNAVGERVSWMINHKQNSASIRLDPPVLGKLDVQVRVSDDATTITIQTQHAQTRDLIDAASLRLRDYLQESGFQNVNVDVSQRQDQPQGRAQSSSPESGGEQADAAPEQDSDAQRPEAAGYSRGQGLLDTFA